MDGLVFPPNTTSVYIEATAGRNAASGSKTYFAGFVEPGGIFRIADPQGGLLESSTTIVIKDKEGEGSIVLQSVTFGTDCSVNLSLFDRFGANSIVQWTNEQQGTVDASPQNAVLTYTISNIGTVPAELLGLETTITFTNPETTILEDVFLANELVPVGGDFTVSLVNEIIVLGRRQYTFAATARARQGLSNCSASAFTDFTAGYTVF